MTRRLDIFSLLCREDDTEFTVSPGHFRNDATSLSSATSSSHRPPTPPAKSFLGLDALVHAATEERRRLSGSSNAEIPDLPHPVSPTRLSPVKNPISADRYPDHDLRAHSPALQSTKSTPFYCSFSSTSSQTSRLPVIPVDGSLNLPPLPPVQHVSHEESNIRADSLPLSPHAVFSSDFLLEDSVPFYSFDHSERGLSHNLHPGSQSRSLQKNTFGERSPAIRPSSSSYDGALEAPAFLVEKSPIITSGCNLASSFRSPSNVEVIPRSRKRPRHFYSPSVESECDDKGLHMGRTALTNQNVNSEYFHVSTSPMLNPVSLSEVVEDTHGKRLLSSVDKNQGQERLHSPALVHGSGDGHHSSANDVGNAPFLTSNTVAIAVCNRGELQPLLCVHPELASEKHPAMHNDLHNNKRPTSDVRAASSSHIVDSLHDSSLHFSPPQKTIHNGNGAHEWLLEHYDKEPAPPPGRSPRQPPSDASKLTLPSMSSPPRMAELSIGKNTYVLTTMPEAAVALEHELDELLIPMQPTEGPQGRDVEVDRAVTELVEETLEADDGKLGEVSIEAELIDELLSLVDDPPAHHRSTRHGETSKHKPSLPQDEDIETFPRPITHEENAHFVDVGQSANDPKRDSGSMPPPLLKEVRKGKEQRGMHRLKSDAKLKKVKVQSKTIAKHKITVARSRPKTGPELKLTPFDNAPSPPMTKIGASSSIGRNGCRSRSASAMPSGSVGVENDDTRVDYKEQEEINEDDDKLYCICKTRYDEDRIMIACDRCDEWYHMQCVKMQELEVDLVDQFFCPPCIESNPELCLYTTYKTRCRFGLEHADSSSLDACHRPTRGFFSKYCSDECGIQHMEACLKIWIKEGGNEESLWETVKHAKKREGVVAPAADDNKVKPNFAVTSERLDRKDYVPGMDRNRNVERLNLLLDSVVKLREGVKSGLESVVWRKKLLELATERAAHLEQCGWDQRLCFGDQEWAEFSSGVLESYEAVDGRNVSKSSEQVGEWWCVGKKICDRHAGWQTIRYRDVCNEMEKNGDALANLTTRERELRKRIADMLTSYMRGSNDLAGKSSPRFKFNGHSKEKSDGGNTKKRKGAS